MKAVFPILAVLAAVASAQERCDTMEPKVFCNTTEILAFQTSECKPYHIFLARGSDEPYPGRQGNMSREICSRLGSNDCGFESIVYPAKSTSWGKEEWCKSAAQGAANGQAQLKDYHQRCPESKLILLGFSQGGAVTQNILSGGGGKVFECDLPTNPALDYSIGSNIIAVATFGAVIRSRNQNFTIGDGVNFDGQRAQTAEELEALNKYSDRLRDYCNYGDPMCAVGSSPWTAEAHLNYFLKYNEEVVDWVTEKAKTSVGKSSDEESSSEPSSSLSLSSVVAKTAVVASATSSILMSATLPASDSSETRPAQTGTPNAGVASRLENSISYKSLVVAMAVTLLLAI